MARTEGQWQKGISLITPSENVPILLRNSYLNFGGELIGETGYGFRDNGGVMQVKDSGGSWANFGAGGGVSDGDKGDIIVSGSGTVWSLDNDTVAQNELATTGTPDGTKFLRDDMQWTTIPGGGDALVANPLSQFAATTSLQLKNTISDETGSGALVFANSPVLVTPTGIVKGDVGLGNVDNTSDATKNAAAVTLTNKTFALGSNTFSGTLAQLNTAITDANIIPEAGGTFTGDISVPDEAYGVGWNSSLEVPTKNALYDKIETLGAGSAPSRSARFGWVFPDGTINGATDIAAEKWHTISAMWYELEADGDFLKRNTSGFGANFYYTAANALIVRENCTVALVNCSSGDPTGVNALTASQTKIDLFIAEMISFCKTNNFDGVDLDTETFGTADMTANQYIDFKNFVRQLGNALHAEGLILSIEVPPIWNTAANTESGSGDAWDSNVSQGYYRLVYADFNSLPVDMLVIMAYDYQYDYSAGEPNQPLKWLEEILRFARQTVDETKIEIVAGIPSAGYSGATGGYTITGRTYDYLSVQTGFGGASRDSLSGELIWANGGTSYAACDDTSIQLKVAQAEAVGIYKYALWHIGNNQYGGDALTYVHSNTAVLPQKRVVKRTGTTTSSATPTINTDRVDYYSITAQTVDITSFTTNLSGTRYEGQPLWISITGTAARAITWGPSFEASTVALPTTTITTARLDVGFVWNSVTSKFRCIAVA